MMVRRKTIVLVLFSALFFNFFAIGKEFKNYSQRELDALREFRPLVKHLLTHDYMHHNAFLLRWLREHNLQTTPAVADLKKYMEWRRKSNVDNILNLDLRGHSKHLPLRLEGYDREGRPILEFVWGKWDLRKYMLAGKREDVRQYITQAFEKVLVKIRQTQEETGRDIDQFQFLVDLDGFSATTHLCVPCWTVIYDHLLVGSSGDFAFAKNLTLVNTPRIFSPVLSAIKQAFSAGIVEKLFVLGQDKNEWKKELAKHFAPEQLPPRLGGTNSNFS